jgi:hypothetical protein
MADVMEAKTRAEKKQLVQSELMHGMANALGYWQERLTGEERDKLGEDGLAELQALMQEQADRVAKMFGYEKAWVN